MLQVKCSSCLNLVLILVAALGICAADAPVTIGESDAKKAAIERPAPAYPMTARQLKITGRVEVQATVDENGVVQDVKGVRGNAILMKSALDAVKKWRFHAFEDGGKKVPAIVTLSFEFSGN